MEFLIASRGFFSWFFSWFLSSRTSSSPYLRVLVSATINFLSNAGHCALFAVACWIILDDALSETLLSTKMFVVYCYRNIACLINTVLDNYEWKYKRRWCRKDENSSCDIDSSVGDRTTYDYVFVSWPQKQTHQFVSRDFISSKPKASALITSISLVGEECEWKIRQRRIVVTNGKEKESIFFVFYNE